MLIGKPPNNSFKEHLGLNKNFFDDPLLCLENDNIAHLIEQMEGVVAQDFAQLYQESEELTAFSLATRAVAGTGNFRGHLFSGAERPVVQGVLGLRAHQKVAQMMDSSDDFQANPPISATLNADSQVSTESESQ
jgi:hypothetical protein